MKRLLRGIGFSLALGAAVAMIFHADRFCDDQSAEASIHCHLCHTVSIDSGSVLVDVGPIYIVSLGFVAANDDLIQGFLINSAASRGPPDA